VGARSLSGSRSSVVCASSSVEAQCITEYHLHGSGAGKVERVRSLALSLDRDGVDEPMPGLGVGSKVGTGNIGIGHDDSVQLQVRFHANDVEKQQLTPISANRVALSVGRMLSSGEEPTATIVSA
jgi:hypothetical protein